MRTIARKGFWFSVSLLFLGVSCFAPGINEASAASEKIRLSMGGASTGTWIYMFCAAMTDHWKRYIPNMDVTLLATAGTTANYIPLSKGELDLAGASTAADYYATNGMYFTKNKISNFCSMMPATKSFYHAFTYADSPIKTWADLDGKKVHIGARASPTSINSEEICKALGIKPKFIYSTPAEATDMVKDRRVEAMIYGVGAPWSAILDIATNQKIRFIPMTREQQKKVYDYRPYLVPDLIPAKTYSFQQEDLPLVSGFQTVNVRPGLAEEIVYQLTKTAWSHWDEIVRALAAAKWVKPADISKMIAPIHPGAVKYYREIGVQIPEKWILKK